MRRIKLQLFRRRETWVLTVRGWLFGLAVLGVLLLGLFSNIHGFLAINAPIQADALIVEGWLEDENIAAAISEFKARNYKVLVTTGVPLARGFYLSQYKDYANLTAATLRAIGFNSSQLVAVPAEYAKRDRTFSAALALKRWLDQTQTPIKSLNVYTAGAHARRSWMLYRKALGSDIKVGIISVADPEYDAKHWWKSSAGVKKVMTESVSYLYTQVFNRAG